MANSAITMTIAIPAAIVGFRLMDLRVERSRTLTLLARVRSTSKAALSDCEAIST